MFSSTDPNQVLDPLPQCRLLPEPDLSGRIKLRNEDFLVEELPLYQPSGRGEHLYLFIQKEGIAHSEMIRHLRQHYKVRDRDIGFAGMKDRNAVTRQLVSIHLPESERRSLDFNIDGLNLLWSDRHTNKLRRGHLQGNRFSIRIRDIDPLKAPQLQTRLRSLVRVGVPNYYGIQRFGYRCNTHLLGEHLVNGAWEALASELLGARGASFPKRQLKAREHFDAGRYKESLQLWSRNEFAETTVLRNLIRGDSFENSVRRIPASTLTFWISAYQSAAFNRVLDHRIEHGLLDSILPGDVAIRSESRKQFVAHQEVLQTEDFQNDIRAQKVSATGPMWGGHMLRPGGETLRNEQEVLDSIGFNTEGLESCAYAERGTRRPLRIPLSNIEIDSGVDNHGGYVRTAFDLPRGAYATVVLRELIDDLSSENDFIVNDHASPNSTP